MKKITLIKLVLVLSLSVLFLFSNGPLTGEQALYFLEAAPSQEAGLTDQKQVAAEGVGQEQELRAEAAKITKETRAKQKQLVEEEKQRLKKLAEQTTKEEREFIAQQKKLALQRKERQKKLAEQEIKRQQELEAKQKELAREIEEKRRQIIEEEARRLQEIRMKQEELARQIEERQKQIVEKEARRLQELKAKEAELTRLREENLKRIAEERAKKLYQLSKLEQERKAKEAKLKQELQVKREKEERQREESRKREQQLQEELVRKKEMQRQRLADLEIKRQEEQVRLAQERRVREKEREERQKQLARQKEWQENKLAEEKIKREKELLAKQEQAVKEKLEKQKQMAQLKAQQEELAREKEKWQKKMSEEEARSRQELKAQKARESQAKQMEALLEKEQRLKGQAEQKAKREEELRAKKEQSEQQKAWEEKQLVAKNSKHEQEQRAKQESAAREREKKQKKLAGAKAEQPAKTKPAPKAPQQRVAIASSEPATKLTDTRRLSAQEKALTKAGSTKHQEDEAKIRKADELWIEARKLYNMGMYKESIRAFEEIIKIEGNPRIKYTPYAKDYIEKANLKVEEQNKEKLNKAVDSKENEMMDEVAIRQIPPYVEPPVNMQRAKEPLLIEPPLIRKQLTEKKITMDFDQVELKSVVSFLAKESGINFVVSQKVLEMGLKVTTRFDQAPMYDVVKYVTKSLGLVYRIDKDIVWIAHPEEIAQEALETRVYYLNKGGGLFTEFSGTGGGTTEGGLGSSSAQISKISTIEDTLKEAVSWPQDAKLTFDKRINALIVRNTPQNLQMLEDMIYSLDIVPLQILIEARFLEMDVTDTKEFGLEWKFANEDFAIQQKDGSFMHGVGKDSGVDFSTFTSGSEGLNLSYKGLLTTPQFQTALHALEESKKIKTLSCPRITTLNNQMAAIKVVDEWIYPTRYEYEIVQFDKNGDGDFNDADETLFQNVPKDFVRRDVGILLRVIPSVGADRKTISLSLIPEVSEATADYFAYSGEVKLPKFTSRNLSTTVVVNSGDTVVLGGLIKENRTKITTKVPLLADIPFVGVFFRKNTDSIERKNLLIFVTAKVLTAAGEEIVVANAKQ
jgi:type II secretory pathway component GspD/PulD (secretin)